MLDLFAQGFVQLGFETIEGNKCRRFSRQPVQMFHHSPS